MSTTAKKSASKASLALRRVYGQRTGAAEPLSDKGEVFLSYNSADKQVAKQVAAKLASAGYRIANDEDAIQPGENWLAAIGDALNRSDAVVFFLSRAALRSDSTPLELNFLLSTKRFKNRVVPVLVDTAVDDVPWIVRHLPFVSMRSEAADVTRGAKAVLKELDERV